MKNNYFYDALKQVNHQYDINGLFDIVLNHEKTVIAYADINKDQKVTLNVIFGSLEVFGFEDLPSIQLDQIFRFFDIYNHYAKVEGIAEYYNRVYKEITSFAHKTRLAIPIIVNGKRMWIDFSIKEISKAKALRAVFLSDVSDIMLREEAMFAKTHHDSLTGLFNRYTLDYHYGERYLFSHFHVLYLDLDNFKQVNDRYGHAAGNQYLKDFGQILTAYEKDHNRFYRLGGDEFVGLFFEPKKIILEMAEEILEKTRQLAKKYFKDEPLSVSIGIIKATKREDVIHKADQVLYQAKHNGKNQVIYEIEA